MLHEFLTTNHQEILERSRRKIAARPAPRPTEAELRDGVPLFLEQLIARLRGSMQARADMSASATLHGRTMQRVGITVSALIHGYGDVCQAVTELAREQGVSISAGEYQLFNRCLDEAMAESVTEFASERERSIHLGRTEHLGSVAHEMRNMVSAAILSFEALKRGNLVVEGSTSALLASSLMGLRDLVDRSLVSVRLEAGRYATSLISVAAFVEELEVAALLEARTRGLRLVVCPVEPGLYVGADRQLLASAATNLLQNALKFTHAGGTVTLEVRSTGERILIEVSDECGGLPGDPEDLFRPFEQKGKNRSGLGLGLTISRRAVEACGGTLRARSLPGTGCVFCIDLKRQPPPSEIDPGDTDIERTPSIRLSTDGAVPQQSEADNG